MAEMATISTILSIGGTVVSALGQMRQGKAEQQAANYQAAELQQRAGQERAVAQRQAIENRRQARLLASTAQARGAAGGGSALDPTVVNTIGDIMAEGELGALGSLYAGEERARGNEGSAALRRFEGRNARSAAKIGAFSTLGTGLGGTFYNKYGSSVFGTQLPSPVEYRDPYMRATL